MAAMAELGIKINGEWHNVTISINDETNEWGKNINVWKGLVLPLGDECDL